MTLYNEFDPFAAAWLRELIADRLIAPGTVDARDIRDIIPTELVGHRQVHLFAGIGVWSAALRLAGVADDAEVWTASCPCQPFSAAGKRGGTADERHLWPAAFHLIRHCRPRLVMGEQVASPDGLAWLDLVLADLEAEGYACRAVDLCAAGVGSPHIRQRLYWLAYAVLPGGRSLNINRSNGRDGSDDGRQEACGILGARGEVRGLADSAHERHERSGNARRGRHGPAIDGDAGGLADAECGRLKELRERDGGTEGRSETVQSGHDAVRCGEPERVGNANIARPQGRAGMRECPDQLAAGARVVAHGPGPTNGLWRDPDWLLCRDAKWRPVEPSHVVVVDDGSALHAVAGCSGTSSQEAETAIEVKEGGEVNEVQALRTDTRPKEVPIWTSGTPIDDGEKEVLRQEVHGGVSGGSHQSCVAEELPTTVGEAGQEVLRVVRKIRRSDACPPCGQEPDEQLFGEPPDAVLFMPLSIAFAELRGQRKTLEALSALRSSMLEEGALCDPFDSPQEAWKCLGPHSRARISRLIETLRLTTIRPHPLADAGAFRNRVALLRGAGNAIVVAQAAAFIRANIDLIPAAIERHEETT